MEMDHLMQHVTDLLAQARRDGASSAEAAASLSTAQTTEIRNGQVDTVQFKQSRHLAITVYFGQRSGSASTHDFSTETIQHAVQAACDAARYTSEDPAAGLADAELMATDIPDLQLYHPASPTQEQVMRWLEKTEAAAFAHDPRIIHAQGTEFTNYSGTRIYGNSHGFLNGWGATSYSLTCSMAAEEKGEKQPGFWYGVSRVLDELPPVEAIGQEAARRAVSRLGAVHLKTQRIPVIFAAPIATSLLSHFAAAIDGNRLYQNASFLQHQLGQLIFPTHVRIYEQPHLLKGLGSAPFDNDGVATQAKEWINAGELLGYAFSSYSGRKMGAKSTGNAGGLRNLTLETTEIVPDLTALLKKMDKGLLITGLIGMGVNLVTGDYSRGADGFWVEGGKIQYPVKEITIASSLKNMFLGLQAMAMDIETRGNWRVGSCLIDQVMVAGKN